MAASLILKRALANRSSSQWKEDDYDVISGGVVVGRILRTYAAPQGTPWMWTFIFPHGQGRWPTHGYENDREAACRRPQRCGGGTSAHFPLVQRLGCGCGIGGACKIKRGAGMECRCLPRFVPLERDPVSRRESRPSGIT
jgi:hypothetical protein